MFKSIDATIDERIKKHKETRKNGTSTLNDIIYRCSHSGPFGGGMRDKKIPKETGNGKRLGENTKKI
jgi:hypothetical protein